MHVPSRLGCKDPLDCGALVPVFCLSSHHRCDRTLPSIQKSCLRASPMTTTKAMSSSTKRAAASTNSRHLVASTIELLSSNGHRERRRRSRSTSVDISATYPLASIHVVPKRRLKKMSYAEECVLDQIDDCLAVSHSHTLTHFQTMPSRTKAISRKSGKSDPALQHGFVVCQSQTFRLAFQIPTVERRSSCRGSSATDDRSSRRAAKRFSWHSS